MQIKKNEKRKLPTKKQVLYLACGIVALLLGFWMAILYSADRTNMIVAMGTIILIPGGGFLLYMGIRRAEREAVIVGSKKPLGPVNSLNIYARKDENDKLVPDKIVFENVKRPLGQPQQCTNNGNWYFVHIFDLVTGKLKPFVLPDSQFFDPSEFGNVLEMPAHRRLFEKKISLLQKVAPWVMVVALLISIIGIVAVGG